MSRYILGSGCAEAWITLIRIPELSFPELMRRWVSCDQSNKLHHAFNTLYIIKGWYPSHLAAFKLLDMLFCKTERADPEKM